MKKAAVLLTFLVLFAAKVTAQQARFGIRSGFNYSSIAGDLTEGLKFRFSGHGGIFVSIDLTDNVSFQPELLYSSQGFQFSSDLASIQNPGTSGEQNDFRNNVQLNFLTLPLMLKFEISNGLEAHVGPQFGFLINQVNRTKNLNENNALVSKSVIDGNFQLDYGATLGLGFKLGPQWQLDPRAYIGLRNRLNGLSGNLYNVNVALQLGLAYTFDR